MIQQHGWYGSGAYAYAILLGGIQGQAGCGSGQPGGVVGDPAHSRGLKPNDHCGPFQPRPFYGSMIPMAWDTTIIGHSGDGWGQIES